MLLLALPEARDSSMPVLSHRCHERVARYLSESSDGLLLGLKLAGVSSRAAHAGS
jgi:hypothetical protein